MKIHISDKQIQIFTNPSTNRDAVSHPHIGRLRTSAPMMLGQRFLPAEGSSCHVPTPGVAGTYTYTTNTNIFCNDIGVGCFWRERRRAQSATTSSTGVAGCSGSWLALLDEDSPLEHDASSSVLHRPLGSLLQWKAVLAAVRDLVCLRGTLAQIHEVAVVLARDAKATPTKCTRRTLPPRVLEMTRPFGASSTSSSPGPAPRTPRRCR